MDPTLFSLVDQIGYLRTHNGALSDHAVGYIDLNEQSLFTGVLNHPLPMHSWEILIKQEDKVQEFLLTLMPMIDAHTLDTQVFQLAQFFSTTGASTHNIVTYLTIYGQFLEFVNGTAKKVGKKIYGYMRSPTLGAVGQHSSHSKMHLTAAIAEHRSPHFFSTYSIVYQWT